MHVHLSGGITLQYAAGETLRAFLHAKKFDPFFLVAGFIW